MKQMSLIEMDGFLKGKCIPRDLKVNETNAEYLVRKFAEAEAKISALTEDHQKAIESIKQADSAVKLAHEKFSALAAENAMLKQRTQQLIDIISNTDNHYCMCGSAMKNHVLGGCGYPTGMFDYYYNQWLESDNKTPATDAFLAEVRAQAFNDLCAVFVKDATVVGLDDGDIVTVKEATDALLHCAEQLRKGGNQ
ncbi:hypothetical protein V5G93_15050 [Escherichia albertii]|uniref:hypothetical protein n=1 Tax=Escherichia albertii TaxID=208962 RepID=UPI0037BA6384